MMINEHELYPERITEGCYRLLSCSRLLLGDWCTDEETTPNNSMR